MPRHSMPNNSPKIGDIVRIVRKNSKLAHKLDGRSQVLFAVPKPEGRGGRKETDQVLVGLYDYDRGDSVVTVIDTKQQSVIDVRETDAQFQLSDEERREAERIAAEDSRVRTRLAGGQMNALTRLYFPPGAVSSSGHRYAIVFLRPNKSERWYAIVDLTARTTVDLVSRRQLAGE